MNAIRSKLSLILPAFLYTRLRKFRKFILSFFHKQQIIFYHDGNIKINLLNNNYRSYVLQDAAKNHEPIKRKILNIIIGSEILKKKNIIDIGCHCGDNSIPWSKKIKTKVYALDPSIDNINFINKICIKNNIKNLFTFCCAISDLSGKNFSFKGDVEELYHIELLENKNNKNNKTITTFALDDFCEEKNIKNIGLMHIDAEGFDFKILKGSKKIIKKDLPFLVSEVCLNSKNYKNTISLLKDNYKTFLINEKSGTDPLVRNLIAIPNFINEQIIAKKINDNLFHLGYDKFKYKKNESFLIKVSAIK